MAKDLKLYVEGCNSWFKDSKNKRMGDECPASAWGLQVIPFMQA